MTKLRELLIRHEGCVLTPYVCTAGKQTIGVGRNLEDVGVTKEEALFLLDNDIARCRAQADASFPWFKELDSVRQDVVISMIFNLGLKGFKGFRRGIVAIEMGDYSGAAVEFLDSKWAKQVGKRAHELAFMMKSGKYSS